MTQFDPRDEYSIIFGSDSIRDGFYMSVATITGKEVAEIFYSDSDDKMIVTVYQQTLPFELVEWMVATAKFRLVPRDPQSLK